MKKSWRRILEGCCANINSRGFVSSCEPLCIRPDSPLEKSVRLLSQKKAARPLGLAAIHSNALKQLSLFQEILNYLHGK